MSNEYRPRLSIELTEEQSSALLRLIPWGLKNQLFSAIVDQLIPLLEAKGTDVIAMIITNNLKVDKLVGKMKDGKPTKS